MIDTVILGASTRKAGELIRLLINHPDVNIINLTDATTSGVHVSNIHHGLIGETDLAVTHSLPSLSDVDLLFIAADDKKQLPDLALYPNLKIIDLTPDFSNDNVVYGVPELNRKPLVRGAKYAAVPTSPEVLLTLLLLPLVSADSSLSLPTDINIHLTASQDVIAGITTDALARVTSNLALNKHTIILSTQVSQSHNHIKVALELNRDDISSESLQSLYSDFYSDHNLTHVTDHSVDPIEVRNTDRAIISIEHSDDSPYTTVSALADPQLRGAAGDAVHIMNLMFGLYEKTGLTLKASTH